MPTKLNSQDIVIASEYEKRMAAYRMQAQLYIFTHVNLIINSFARQIYSDIEVHKKLDTNHINLINPIESVVYSIINKYIKYIGNELLVLFNPKTGQPAVIEDAMIFTPYDVDAFEEKMGIEYLSAIDMNQYKWKGTMQDMATRAGKRVGKAAGGAGLSYTASKLLNQADRFSKLAEHYNGGHKARLRIQRSFRGKTPQSLAYLEIAAKNKRFMGYATKRAFLGKWIKKGGNMLISGSLKPISPADAVFNVEVAQAKTTDSQNKALLTPMIIDGLTEYCKRNENYSYLINQTYLSQGQ